MHFNENANRPQARRRAGDPLFKVQFPKFKKGECTAKPVKTDATFRMFNAHLFIILNTQLLGRTIERLQHMENWGSGIFITLLYYTGYTDELMDLLFEYVLQDPQPYFDELLKIPVPDDLCAQYERPAKEDVIAALVSRFNKETVWTPCTCLRHQVTCSIYVAPHKC